MDANRLTRATAAAADALTASGVAARSDGTTLSCTNCSGTRVALRNSLRILPAFAGDFIVSQAASEIVRAWVAQERRPT